MVNFENMLPKSIHYLQVSANNIWKLANITFYEGEDFHRSVVDRATARRQVYDKALKDILYSEQSLYRLVSGNLTTDLIDKVAQYPKSSFSDRVIDAVMQHDPYNIRTFEKAIDEGRVEPYRIYKSCFDAHAKFPVAHNTSISQVAKAFDAVMSDARYRPDGNGSMIHKVMVQDYGLQVKNAISGLKDPLDVAAFVGDTDRSKLSRAIVFSAFDFGDEPTAVNFVLRNEKKMKKEMIEVLGSAHPNKIIGESGYVGQFSVTDGLRRYEWSDDRVPTFSSSDFMSNVNPYVETSIKGKRELLEYKDDDDFIRSINMSRPGDDMSPFYQQWLKDSRVAGMVEKYLPHSADIKALYVSKSENPRQLLHLMGPRHLTQDFYESLVQINPSMVRMIDPNFINEAMLIKIAYTDMKIEDYPFKSLGDNKNISNTVIMSLIGQKSDGINALPESLLTNKHIIAHLRTHGASPLPQFYGAGVGKLYDSLKELARNPGDSVALRTVHIGSIEQAIDDIMAKGSSINSVMSSRLSAVFNTYLPIEERLANVSSLGARSSDTLEMFGTDSIGDNRDNKAEVMKGFDGVDFSEIDRSERPHRASNYSDSLAMG